MKVFEDCKLMFLVTFDHQRVHKSEVVQLYLNATVSVDGSIKSKVSGVEVTITVEDIREEFRLKEASDLDVSSHAFNQKIFWDEIRRGPATAYVKFNKKNELLKPEWEREIDIIYKCLESKVAGVDEITLEKITILSAIMENYKCDWARHILNSLGTFILKAVKPSTGVLSANV